MVHVDRRSDEGLDEIEDCWQLRDVGYHTIWASEVTREMRALAAPQTQIAAYILRPREGGGEGGLRGGPTYHLPGREFNLDCVTLKA